MDSNKIFGILVILLFTGLSVSVVLFLKRVKDMNKGEREVREVKEDNSVREVNDNKGIKDENVVYNPTPISPLKNSSSQTPNDQIHDLLQNFNKENDSFAFTRGEDGNLLLICSLKIPFDLILNNKSKENNDNNFELILNDLNLKKVIKNAVSQFISIRNPDYKYSHNKSNFLKLLYTKKESFIGNCINKTLMPEDIFEIVKKTIRGLREFYKNELSYLNSKAVICLFYELEDKIVNLNVDNSNNKEDNDNSNDNSYNTFLSFFFTNDHFDFIQDVRKSLNLYEKKKKYLKTIGLENQPVLCTQDDPKVDFDILDFIIFVCSKVLADTISNKIY